MQYYFVFSSKKFSKHYFQQRMWQNFFKAKKSGVLEHTALFPFPRTSRQLQLISGTSGFTRLSMTTKYVCRGLISLYVSFHNNVVNKFTCKNLQVGGGGGGKEKEPNIQNVFLKQFRG